MKKPEIDQQAPLFGTSNCRRLTYFLRASLDKFDIERFRSHFSEKVRTKDQYEFSCAPRDPITGEYHIHANWLIASNEIRFEVEYVEGTISHASDEREPYAEGFLIWLGRFFKYSTVATHIHAEFAIPVETWRTRVLPLPLRTTIVLGGNKKAQPVDAEIFGVTLRLPSKPEGVASVWIHQQRESWIVQLIADRRIGFEGFTPHIDLSAMSDVLNIVGERLI